MKCTSCGMSVGDIHAPTCALFIPLTEVTEEQVKNLAEPKAGEVADVAASNGDCYDEDTGEYLGQLESGLEPGTTTIKDGLPAQISMYVNGYWYIFKPQSRYKEEQQEKISG